MGIQLCDRILKMWEKEKLLVTSNFSFSHNVFKRYLLLISQNEYLWSKGLTFYHTIMTFMNLIEEAFKKNCGKGKIVGNQHFSPFPTIFLSLSMREIIISATFILLSANVFNWTSLNSVV